MSVLQDTTQTEMREMTVYEALRIRKRYRDRLDKMISHEGEYSTNNFVTPYIPKKDVQKNGETTEAITNALKRAFDMRAALLRNIDALDAAIYQANALTKVEIAGREYTVSEALAKLSRIQGEVVFYQDINTSITKGKKTVMDNNDLLLTDEKAQAYVSKKMEAFKDSVTDPNELEKYQKIFQQEYADNNTHALLDPYGLEGKIQGMIDELKEFADNVDTILSMSNMTTKISVSLVPEAVMR